MPTFNYKAIDKDGKNIEGALDAKDKFDLYHLLKKEGRTVVSAKETKEANDFSLDNLLPFLSGVKAHDKITFARNLGQMIEAGLPITRGLSIMERQQKKGKLKDILTDLSESLSKGDTLSDAMKKYPNVFDTLFTSMVKAGEESGNLATALKNIANQMEKSYQLTKKIKGAMIYPSVIFSLMIIIGVLMMVYMVPTLTTTFTGLGVQLPLSTRIIIGLSHFLIADFAFVILGAILLVAFVAWGLRTAEGGRLWDAALLHLPIVGEITREINSARTARTLSSLLSSGVDIVVAIKVTKDVVQNSYYKNILDEVEVAIQKGEQISAIFTKNEKLYPLFVGEMVAVGEETGKIGEMLLGVAAFYEEEVDQKTKDMSSIIEPVLMIVIGVAVGFFALAILGPTYSLANAIS
jgi:type IV pilus assembly protein PilC